MSGGVQISILILMVLYHHVHSATTTQAHPGLSEDDFGHIISGLREMAMIEGSGDDGGTDIINIAGNKMIVKVIKGYRINGDRSSWDSHSWESKSGSWEHANWDSKRPHSWEQSRPSWDSKRSHSKGHGRTGYWEQKDHDKHSSWEHNAGSASWEHDIGAASWEHSAGSPSWEQSQGSASLELNEEKEEKESEEKYSSELVDQLKLEEKTDSGSSEETVEASSSNWKPKTSNDKFEERLYPEMLMVCTKFNGNIQDKKDNNEHENSWKKISAYLNGENTEKKELSQNMPIVYTMTLNNLPDFKFTTCNFLTQKNEEGFFSSYPAPTNPEVFLEEVNKAVYYVRTFSGPGGSTQDKVWEEESRILAEQLIDAGLKFDVTESFGATYSQREETSNRRDEVMFRKE